MAQYKTCPYCGAHLDPGERCDCKTDDGVVVYPWKYGETIPEISNRFESKPRAVGVMESGEISWDQYFKENPLKIPTTEKTPEEMLREATEPTEHEKIIRQIVRARERDARVKIRAEIIASDFICEDCVYYDSDTGFCKDFLCHKEIDVSSREKE